MTEHIIVLDIETTPSQSAAVRADLAAAITAPAQYKKPESIAEWLAENREKETDAAVAKTSFDGALGNILCVGVTIADDKPMVFCHAESASDVPTAEPFMLAEFRDWLTGTLGRYDRPIFVGHNILEFDFRMLRQRAIINRVQIPLPFNAKPWDGKVFDTMTEWSGLKNRITLDKLAKAFGLEGKGDITGADVWPMVQAGKIAAVCDYCKDDVHLTREIYKRMTFQ